MGRFNRRGQERVYFVPTLASQSSPTAVQITAGTRLDVAIRSISGFTFTSDRLDAADMSDTWAKTIGGGDSAADSSITLYEGQLTGDTERTIETALAKGSTGFVVFCPQGAPVATNRARVWPVTVLSNNPDESAENATATYTVGFSIPNPPTTTATIA
jgi:hypothetical protein